MPINLNIGCTITQNIIGIETFGSWGSNGHKLVKEIGKKVIEETDEKKSAFFLFQSISNSIAIQKGNVSCILGTVPHSEGLDEIFEFLSSDVSVFSFSCNVRPQYLQLMTKRREVFLQIL